MVVTLLSLLCSHDLGHHIKFEPDIGPRLIRFDRDFKQLCSRRQRCDIASVVAALQNTGDMHSAMRQRLPANSSGKDPFSTEQNFGFDARYSNGRTYMYDTVLDDEELLIRHDSVMSVATLNGAKSLSVAKSGQSLSPSQSGIPGNQVHKESITDVLTTPGGGGGSSRNLHSCIHRTSSFPDISTDMIPENAESAQSGGSGDESDQDKFVRDKSLLSVTSSPTKVCPITPDFRKFSSIEMNLFSQVMCLFVIDLLTANSHSILEEKCVRRKHCDDKRSPCFIF